RAGDKIWKTSDPALERALRQSFEGEQPRFRRPIKIEAHGHVGSPLTLLIRDELGNVVEVSSSVSLESAVKHPLTTEGLRDQLGRLGGTPFRLQELNNELQGSVILPVSQLNAMRRLCVERLEALRSQPRRWKLHSLPRREDAIRVETPAGRALGSKPAA